MATITDSIEYETLVRWTHSLEINNDTGLYELKRHLKGAHVQKLEVSFDNETGKVYGQPVIGRAHPIKNVAGVAGGDDIEVFALDDIVSKVTQDAIGELQQAQSANEALKSRIAKKDEAISALKQRNKELEALQSNDAVLDVQL